MKPQYVFSLAAVAATVALVWRPSPPTPVTSTRVEEGLEVRVTKNAAPHRFEELPVPSLRRPPEGVFLMPKSYLRSRLCAGDDVMLAAAQARMLITPGEGAALGRIASDCASDSPLCPLAKAALTEDGGLNADELEFFAEVFISCDRFLGAELRNDLRLPLDVRERAWAFFRDAGAWSPELGALVEEHFRSNDDLSPNHFRLASILNAVTSDSEELLDASTRLMDRVPYVDRVLLDARAPAVRQAACARLGCDAGLEGPPPLASGIELHEELAACVLQGPKQRQAECLDDLAELDWSMARSVADRTEQHSDWQGALRAFETREAFDAFARSFGAEPDSEDGGYHPAFLLGEPPPDGLVTVFYTDNGLGTDELAARWANLAPELKGAFFFESDDGAGGLRLSGRLADELYEVSVRRERETLDPRAALALLNAMAAERGSARRFMLLRSSWMNTARFEDPARVAKLVELGLVELLDPEEARESDEW